jgi:hypothetical protein
MPVDLKRVAAELSGLAKDAMSGVSGGIGSMFKVCAPYHFPMASAVSYA